MEVQSTFQEISGQHVLCLGKRMSCIHNFSYFFFIAPSDLKTASGAEAASPSVTQKSGWCVSSKAIPEADTV